MLVGERSELRVGVFAFYTLQMHIRASLLPSERGYMYLLV